MDLNFYQANLVLSHFGWVGGWAGGQLSGGPEKKMLSPNFYQAKSGVTSFGAGRWVGRELGG